MTLAEHGLFGALALGFPHMKVLACDSAEHVLRRALALGFPNGKVLYVTVTCKFQSMLQSLQSSITRSYARLSRARFR